MKLLSTRRRFLRTALGAALLGAFAPMLRLLAGGHTVKNARTLPPWKEESFASQDCLRCLVIGDWGAATALQRKVAQGMARHAEREKPQWILSTGDNFYPIGVSSARDEQFTTKWKDIYSAHSLRLPWYCALGNHDYGDNPGAQVEYSAIDTQWNMPARYYSFRKDSALCSAEFFVLDTQALLKGARADQEKQVQWLREALKSSTATWRVVVGHHMVRSHGAYGDQPFMLKLVKPLLDEYKVHLYLNGHDHDLQYIKRPDDAFVCITSGAGGGARDTGYGAHTRYAATDGGFVGLSFTHTRIHAQFCNAEGAVQYAEDVVEATR
ncbi:MAG: metallophosphoesterase [Candidatus Kapaibacterium sp.]